MKRFLCCLLAVLLLAGTALADEGFDLWLGAFNRYAAQLNLREVRADEFEDDSEYFEQDSLCFYYDDLTTVGVSPDGKGGIEGFYVDGDPNSDITVKVLACTLCAADGALEIDAMLSKAEEIIKRTNSSEELWGMIGSSWIYYGYADEDKWGRYVDVTFTQIDGSSPALPPKAEEPAGEADEKPEELPEAEETPVPSETPEPKATPAPTEKPVYKA